MVLYKNGIPGSSDLLFSLTKVFRVGSLFCFSSFLWQNQLCVDALNGKLQLKLITEKEQNNYADYLGEAPDRRRIEES